MVEHATAANPSILRWARERAGLSLEEVAHALGKDVPVVEGWETGDLAPTIGQLEKLAYQLYKRPLAVFFFPEPPDEETPDSEFRTLPRFEIENLAPDSLYALREARAMQLSLRELTDGENPADSLIFKKIRPRQTQDISALANRVRKHLGIALEAQTKWPSTEDAFKNWRNAIERSGVFVFKRAFKQKAISAFSLLDSEFPVIYINNKTAFSRQVFSLFHELAHILFQTSGITKADISYIDSLTGRDRSIEIACNKFAAELLVPWADFRRQASRYFGDDQDIEILAERYKVSREVIFRRLRDAALIDEAEYDAKAAEWNAEHYARVARRSGGANYYATRAAYLGENYLTLAFSRYDAGRCSVQQLADFLNMKARNVAKFESHLYGRV